MSLFIWVGQLHCETNGGTNRHWWLSHWQYNLRQLWSCTQLKTSCLAINSWKNVLHSSYICFTFALHLLYICFTFALHLFYICFTFFLHLFYICFTFVLHLFYICFTFVLHLFYIFIFSRVSMVEIAICYGLLHFHVILTVVSNQTFSEPLINS